MTKQTMIKNYRKFSPVDGYVLGFIYKHNLYAIIVEEIMPRFMRVERESSKKGGCEKLQFRLNNQYKEQLIRKGAECLGSEDLLVGQYNKGVEFERLITERDGQEFRGKDSVPFYMGGDVNIGGKELQVKLDGAQIVVARTLENLKRGKVRQ